MAAGWQIYLVRHGIAAERGTAWRDDARRPLTAQGAARFRTCVRGAVRYGITIDRIFTSPLVRTTQTADLLARGADVTSRVVPLESLAPGHDAAAVLDELAAVASPGAVALVGHEPDLGQLAAYLLGATRPIPFKKGGMCRIDLERLGSPHLGTLVWFMDPRALRKLGR